MIKSRVEQVFSDHDVPLNPRLNPELHSFTESIEPNEGASMIHARFHIDIVENPVKISVACKRAMCKELGGSCV